MSKIGMIGTGSMIPPVGWGATEEVIWNYSKEFTKRNYRVDIALPYNNEWDSYDIVHVHCANQALMLRDQGIPYIYTIHDINVFSQGKSSYVYEENSEAIEYSELTLVPSRYFVDLFPEYRGKVRYLSHGVNTDFYNPISNSCAEKPRLLCVAKNFVILTDEGLQDDNKGFIYAYEAAKKLGYPITFAGPNSDFFEELDYNFDYENLTIINRDVEKQELRNLYQSHDICLVVSLMESGQPCLVILEALACGLPVVATQQDSYEMGGVEFVKRDIDEICKSILVIKDSYFDYSKSARLSAEERSWKNICDTLSGYYDFYKKKE